MRAAPSCATRKTGVPDRPRDVPPTGGDQGPRRPRSQAHVFGIVWKSGTKKPARGRASAGQVVATVGWAWVELNYRPHAYQAAIVRRSARWSGGIDVNDDFPAVSATERWPALTFCVTAIVTTKRACQCPVLSFHDALSVSRAFETSYRHMTAGSEARCQRRNVVSRAPSPRTTCLPSAPCGTGLNH